MDFDYENNLAFCLNASVFDIENGTILKLVEGQEVARAMKGHRSLSEEEIH
jgi:hypothetical protein